MRLVTRQGKDIVTQTVIDLLLPLTAGATRDHSALFKQTRQKVVDRTYLEVNRLEKRLTKVQKTSQVITDVQLLALMANPPKPEPVQGGFLKSLTGGPNHQRLLAQQVVTWQDDETVTQCPFCESLFMSTFSNLQASI